MASTASDQLAIRTVVVTTRAAVRFHLGTGRRDLARASASRGLLLLEDLDARRELRNGGFQTLAEARRELRALSEAP